MSTSSNNSRYSRRSVVQAPRSPICTCGDPTTIRTSKTAWNPGRKFFGCSKYFTGGGCRYFAWVDEFEGGLERSNQNNLLDEIEVENNILCREIRQLSKENRALRDKVSVKERNEARLLNLCLCLVIALGFLVFIKLD